MQKAADHNNLVSPFTSDLQEQVPVAVVQSSTDSQSSTLVTTIINKIIGNQDFVKEAKEYQQHNEMINSYHKALHSRDKLDTERAYTIIAVIIVLALAIVGIALSGGALSIIIPVALGAIAAETGFGFLLKHLFDQKIDYPTYSHRCNLLRKQGTSKQHIDYMIKATINQQVSHKKDKFIHNYIMTRINDLYKNDNLQNLSVED